jgi:hypothetical protein
MTQDWSNSLADVALMLNIPVSTSVGPTAGIHLHDSLLKQAPHVFSLPPDCQRSHGKWTRSHSISSIGEYFAAG